MILSIKVTIVPSSYFNWRAIPDRAFAISGAVFLWGQRILHDDSDLPVSILVLLIGVQTTHHRGPQLRLVTYI